MFARISRIDGEPQRMDASVRDFRENMVPHAKTMAGFKGAYLLIDRKTGKAMGITMWGTEKDLRESAEAANRLRAQGAKASGSSKPPIVEIYEVAVAEMPHSGTL